MSHPCAVFVALLVGLALLGQSEIAAAKTYRATHDGEVLDMSRLLNPGDTLEIEGGKTYAGYIFFERPGTKDKPITVRGIVVDGKRPQFVGGKSGIEIWANHYVFENLEVTGAKYKCIFHAAHDITLRNVVVRDCPTHGVLSADDTAGSLTMDRCEIYGNGKGDYEHQLYVTTAQDKYPDAVFRLQHSYIHDGNGGNNVKSRAGRNEIYFNWIEGAFFHELELIGPDVPNPPDHREDSDVVGNVLFQTRDVHAVRIGGDGTKDTSGRYRFVNNTVVLAPKSLAPIRLFDGVESVELYNNAFVRRGGGAIELVRDKRVKWARGHALIAGSHNFVPAGSSAVPDALAHMVTGEAPGLRGLAAGDLRPALESSLVDAGIDAPPPFEAAPFPNPRAAVDREPPARGVAGGARGVHGAIDIGAFEAIKNANAPPAPSPAPAPSAAPAPAPRPESPPPPKANCACGIAGRPSQGSGVAALVLVLALLRRRRR